MSKILVLGGGIVGLSTAGCPILSRYRTTCQSHDFGCPTLARFSQGWGEEPQLPPKRVGSILRIVGLGFNLSIVTTLFSPK